MKKKHGDGCISSWRIEALCRHFTPNKKTSWKAGGFSLCIRLFLEVEAQGKIPLRLIIEESVHRPAGIHFDKIAQQGRTGAKAITASKGANTTRLHIHHNRVVGIGRGIANTRACNAFECANPRRTQINKLHQLEIADEGIVDGFVQEGGKKWQAQFAVEDHVVVAIGQVLAIATHLQGQALVHILLRGVGAVLRVELRREPVVYPTEVINEFLITPADIGGTTYRPYEIAVNGQVMPEVGAEVERKLSLRFFSGYNLRFVQLHDVFHVHFPAYPMPNVLRFVQRIIVHVLKMEIQETQVGIGALQAVRNGNA